MIAKVIEDHLRKRIENGELSNGDLVQLIEAIGGYLNLETIPNYGKREGITYNGVKVRAKTNKIQVVKLFGYKYVIDNI